MIHIFNDFEYEITELFKAYRMAHFSLYNKRTTFYNFKENNPHIENFILRDNDFDNYVRFNETEINKNSEDGLYQRIIAGNTIAMFYNIWEDKFRLRIAKKIGLEKKQIKSSIFAELNMIRQSITHNNLTATSGLNRLDKLSFVGNSSELNLSSYEVQRIYEEILKEIDQLKIMFES